METTVRNFRERLAYLALSAAVKGADIGLQGRRSGISARDWHTWR